MEQGIYQNISNKEYHAMTDIVSNSYLGRLAKVPAAAKIPLEETEAMKFGRAFHCYVLEGVEIFKTQFTIPEAFPTKPLFRLKLTEFNIVVLLISELLMLLYINNFLIYKEGKSAISTFLSNGLTNQLYALPLRSIEGEATT